MRKSRTPPKQPEPPPPFPDPPLFGFGNIRKPFLQAVIIFSDSISLFGKPYRGWEPFERQLAYNFALLLRLLAALPQEIPRRRLLNLFLESLGLESKRGRPQKAREKLKCFLHGQNMTNLWESELQEAWNVKCSLEQQRKNQRPRRRRDSRGLGPAPAFSGSFLLRTGGRRVT